MADDVGRFDISDISISAYDEDGAPVPAPMFNAAMSAATLAVGNPNNGKNAVLTIPFADGNPASTTPDDDTAVWAAIDTLYVIVPESKFKNADPALIPKAYDHSVSVRSDALKIELVGADVGDAKYSDFGDPVATRVASGTPAVVSITRALGSTGFASAVTGPFDVRIILTEEPAAFAAADIIVGNGTASAPVKGLPIKGGTDNSPSRRNHGAASGGLTAVYAGGGYANDNALPDATGRDNKYYQYLVTITPKANHDGEVTVSVGQFEDMVKPVAKEYVPLLKSERLTTAGANLDARDERITDGREVLSVTVKTAAIADIYKPSADHLAANGRLKALTVKAIIPAGGYLVLARGKTDSTPVSGVENSSAKLKEKTTAAKLLYNVVYDFGLPFPASDLSNFFRNGGTLQLLHADIAAATGSGLDLAKAVAAVGHADDTGYAGATTGAAVAGSVIISEIMWGLDSDSINSQYIELHNTTAADIGIDNNEWVIAVGSGADTNYTTVVDTVGNNPAGDYWQVPGTDGVSVVQPAAGFFTLVDIVSMNRIGDDGTAAASWAASMRPSDNIAGRRIGTPGAKNVYVMPADDTDDEDEDMTTPSAAVAKVGDLMISEIMVASDDGRLPQWIEIANVSATAVSLSGWSLAVDNDSADADVVGPAIDLDLGDVEIGADQVALVISKESTRNSGVDTAGAARAEGDANAGDFDADRIINVQSQASPTNARYSLISEMGFTLSLMPPQTGAVRKYGDVVGNLDGGWELPMSETGRSSLIRREMDDADMATMGTEAAGWVLASDTMLNGAYRTTYYGSDEDVGTPGYNAGGALPVELSGFNAARDRVTGAVVITWSTQSELNNAGFFIKRSQQTNGRFVVVNPTMISGAGTTAEKQSYTFTDATADPNIVYYYQIEDVSLDGNRQTLTRAHRLKGHIGAAGKATTTWGDLKSSRD